MYVCTYVCNTLCGQIKGETECNISYIALCPVQYLYIAPESVVSGYPLNPLMPRLTKQEHALLIILLPVRFNLKAAKNAWLHCCLNIIYMPV